MPINIAEYQVSFNKYTIQKLNLLEIMVTNSYTNSAGCIEAIAKDHGVDFPDRRGRRIQESYVLNLLAIINGKLDNFSRFIAEAIEKENAE